MNARLTALLVSQLFFLAPANAGRETIVAPIKQLYYYEGHTGALVRQDQMIDPDACGRSDLYILRKDHPHYKELTALLMASHLSGQPLGLYLSGCVQGLPSIIHVVSNR